MKIAWISTAVTLYSETKTEFSQAATNDCLRCFVEGLEAFGAQSTLLLAAGSESRWPHKIFEGSLQISLAEGSHDEEPQTGGALRGMVEWAAAHQDDFDLIVNIGHDYLPISRIGQFKTPFITLPNLCGAGPHLDGLVQARAQEFPRYVWFFSKAQRNFFKGESNPIVFQPLDTASFPPASSFNAATSLGLGWAGRITPEKGLEYALRIARSLGRPLWAAGRMQDQAYFERLSDAFPETLHYVGCLDRARLYEKLGRTEVFLQTQAEGWTEAFGRITAEAFLAGCPVIYHECGANAELSTATGGGVEISRDGGQEQQAYEKAVALDRAAIQKNAMALFNKKDVAAKFLSYAADIAR